MEQVWVWLDTGLSVSYAWYTSSEGWFELTERLVLVWTY